MLSTVRGAFQLHCHDSPMLSCLCPSLVGDECGCTPGHHNCTSSLPNHSTECHKSMEASWVCKTSSPRMNLAVILTANALVVSAYHPRVSSSNTSFKTWRVSPVTVRQDLQPGRFSDSPTVISGLVIISNVLVSVVTRHDFSPFHPVLGCLHPSLLTC
jgi:hypothetical protein